jgi:RNA polymerase sigma-70 factor (ECF subfamily)
MARINEESLLTAARHGDVSAFNKLVLAYQNLVYNTAYRILGESEAAADASQETFLSAFQALKDFRGGSFKVWLLRIVTNACYDQLRLKQRRPATSLEELPDPEYVISLRDKAGELDDFALQRELGIVIQRGLRTLPPDQRVTLVLSDIQGFSYEEIAAVTHTSLGTVKSRLSRGRARLRDYLLAQEELLPRRYRLSR